MYCLFMICVCNLQEEPLYVELVLPAVELEHVDAIHSDYRTHANAQAHYSSSITYHGVTALHSL